MDMGRFLIEVHLRTGRPIRKLAWTQAQHRDRRPGRVPHPTTRARPHQGLPAPKLSTRPLYDVSRHRSPMSRHHNRAGERTRTSTPLGTRT